MNPAGFPAGPRGETPFFVLWKWWLLSYQKPLPATPFMAGSGDGWSAPFVVFGTGVGKTWGFLCMLGVHRERNCHGSADYRRDDL